MIKSIYKVDYISLDSSLLKLAPTLLVGSGKAGLYRVWFLITEHDLTILDDYQRLNMIQNVYFNVWTIYIYRTNRLQIS
jgi:hypothetical protein